MTSDLSDDDLAYLEFLTDDLDSDTRLAWYALEYAIASDGRMTA